MEVVAPQIATPATHVQAPTTQTLVEIVQVLAQLAILAIHLKIVAFAIRAATQTTPAIRVSTHAAAQIHAETLAEIAQTLAETATADFAQTAFAQIVIQSEAKNLFVAALSAILARATLSTQRPTNQIFPLDVFAARPSFILR